MSLDLSTERGVLVMAGVSMLTALEIFTNPDDLEILVWQEASGRFAIDIGRGPGHCFKPLITSIPFTDKLEVAIVKIKEILDGVEQAMTKEFEDRKSIPSRCLNPEGQAIDQSKVLNPDLITQIIAELRERRVASTYEMLRESEGEVCRAQKQPVESGS